MVINITELGETIATTMDDLERTKRGIDSYTGSVYIFNTYSDIVTTDDTYLELKTRQIGSAFIIGHPINGILGSIAGVQPVLGDATMGAWTSQFILSGTTAP